MQSYFILFDMEEGVEINLELLDRVYYDKIIHCTDEKEAAYINSAYYTLKNDITRIGHFLKIKFGINIEENIHTYLSSEFLLFIIDFNGEIDILLNHHMIDRVKHTFSHHLTERYSRIKQILSEHDQHSMQSILGLYAEIQFLDNMRLKTNERIRKI